MEERRRGCRWRRAQASCQSFAQPAAGAARHGAPAARVVVGILVATTSFMSAEGRPIRSRSALQRLLQLCLVLPGTADHAALPGLVAKLRQRAPTRALVRSSFTMRQSSIQSPYAWTPGSRARDSGTAVAATRVARSSSISSMRCSCEPQPTRLRFINPAVLRRPTLPDDRALACQKMPTGHGPRPRRPAHSDHAGEEQQGPGHKPTEDIRMAPCCLPHRPWGQWSLS